MRTQAGGAVQTEAWGKAVGYAYAIYKWDPVTLLAGVLNGPASGITPGTTRFLGVSLGWSVASVAATHLIMVDPGDLWEAQGDGTGGVTAAIQGYNANLNVATVVGGGVTRDNSGVQFVESTIATTSSMDVKLLALYSDPANAVGANARMELRFNKHLRTAEQTAT
jgi:hypothetical protein